MARYINTVSRYEVWFEQMMNAPSGNGARIFFFIGQKRRADRIKAQKRLSRNAMGYHVVFDSKTKKSGYNKSKVVQNTNPIHNL